MSLAGILRFAFDSLVKSGPQLLSPGDPAPDFEALDQNGTAVKLSDLRGSNVVLWFFPKASTPG
jgi:peroxiredoxin